MTPAGEIRARGERLREKMTERSLDAVWITRPADVRYVSGFTGADSTLLITLRRQWLITDFRYVEEAEASAPAFPAAVWREHPASFAGRLAARAGARRVGIWERQVSVAGARLFRKRAAPGRLVAADGLTDGLRAVKSAWELERIRAAIHCAEEAFLAFRKRLKPGMTERDARLDLEWEMRRQGAEDAAFETIAAAGPNASRPHAHAGARRFRAGSPALFDFGARVGGYCSDLTRTLWLGDISARWRRRYELVLAAQEAGIRKAAAGAPGRDAHRAAAAVFRRVKLEKRFGHGFGHGVGLAVHEEPRLGGTARTPLAAGNVATAEPGLYFPGEGGIRVEDMIYVGAKETTRLTTLPRTLDWAVV